jgi:hypothetical protein
MGQGRMNAHPDKLDAEREASSRYAIEAEKNPEIKRRIEEARAIVEEHGCFPDAMTREEFRARSSIERPDRKAETLPTRLWWAVRGLGRHRAVG